MRALYRIAALVLFLVTFTHADPASPYAWRRRAAPMRQLLTAAITYGEAHEGRYPAALSELNVQGVDPAWLATLSYRPDAANGLDERAAGSAVLFHEPLIPSADGAWVAFADGRLEFVRDEASLKTCLEQAALVASLPPPAKQPATAPTTQPGDQITLRVSTPDGQPAPDVYVSAFAIWAEGPFGPPSLQSMVPRPAVYTAANGQATLPMSELARLGQPPSLYALDRARNLVAVTSIAPGDDDRAHRAQLAPGIRVGGSIGSVALEVMGRDVGNVSVFPTLTSSSGGPIIAYQSIGRRFDVLLPPGDYHLVMQGENTESLAKTLRLSPGSADLELDVDLPPARIMLLMGKPAPELDRLAAWRGQPLKLADLRGKHVALCFWYSEGWLTRRVPDLMGLRERLADRLEVILIHAPMPGGLAEVEPRLASLREERWEGRELTLPLAIDTETGKTAPSGRRTVGLGKTAQLYGVSPGQVVLIDPDGHVHDRTTVWDAAGAIRGWLGVPATRPADR